MASDPKASDARARARLDEAAAAESVSKALKKLARALRKLSKADATASRQATGHAASYLATESQLALRESVNVDVLANTFDRQAKRAASDARFLRYGRNPVPARRR
jgi:hypothetical protein